MKLLHTPLLCAASILAAVAPSAFGLGFRIADQNAEATARGNAFAATADNPSAIYYNPAGITQLEGTRALLGAYAITLESACRSRRAGAASHSPTPITNSQSAPQFFVTWKPKDYPIALGLGVYAPLRLCASNIPMTRPSAPSPAKASIAVRHHQSGDRLEDHRHALRRRRRRPSTTARRSSSGRRSPWATSSSSRATASPTASMPASCGIRIACTTSASPTAARRTIDFRRPLHACKPIRFTVATPFGPFPVAGHRPPRRRRRRLRFPAEHRRRLLLPPDARTGTSSSTSTGPTGTRWTPSRSSQDVAATSLSPSTGSRASSTSSASPRNSPTDCSASVGYIYSENSVPNESFNPDRSRFRSPHLQRRLRPEATITSTGTSPTSTPTARRARSPRAPSSDGTYRFDSSRRHPRRLDTISEPQPRRRRSSAQADPPHRR